MSRLELNDEEKILVESGEMVRAVRSLRERLSLGLREAHELAKEHLAKQPVAPHECRCRTCGKTM